MKQGRRGERAASSLALVAAALAVGATAHAQENLSSGRAVYQEACAVCHHTRGTGDGPAAHFLSPRPRDFTEGIFKIRSSLFLATDDDLYRTITQGVPGTLMPAFAYLTEGERRDVVAYVKSFAEDFETKTPEPIAIPTPPPATQQLIAEGPQLYELAGCASCHGERGKGDGPASETLEDIWGYPITPYDFTVPGRMKGGSDVEDVYRALYVGIGGTPMPAYGDVFTEEQSWTLAYYVLSLADDTPPAATAGNSIVGRDLFTGATPFENGGSACIACHSITGIGALGGGALGPDLTVAYGKFGEDGLDVTLTDFPFPVMNPLFSDRPITPEEQAHLTAFLQQAVAAERPAEAVGQLALLAGGGAAVLFLLMHLIWRRRWGAVRQPMVDQSA